MHILIATDAWYPQINGVVRTLSRVRDELQALGHRITVIAPNDFVSVACPTYPEIRLALMPGRRIAKLTRQAAPQAIHIATEGPVGQAARRFCMKRGLPFTTSFHTRFPEYINARFGIPPNWLYALLRRFHAPSRAVMVATGSLRRELEGRGFRHLVPWSRGVDTELFRPRAERLYELEAPIFLYVGRVAVEKNIEAFLKLKLRGSKVVVGDGPQLASLRQAYPAVHFTGAKTGEALARHYAAADVFVFPSRTDTFGLVLLEALASGLPVAAYPVTGPLDLVNGAAVGVLDQDLARAAERALAVSRDDCRAFALSFTWRRCAEQFLDNLAPYPCSPEKLTARGRR
ncbi:MAG: glycosyltransferase family 4 protein [Kiloniellales bacterium]